MSYDFFKSAVSKINNRYECLSNYEYDALMKTAKYGSGEQKQEACDALATAKYNNNQAFRMLDSRDSDEDSYARAGRPKLY